MPRRWTSTAIVLLMVVSAFTMVISIAPRVSATAPTITAYGVTPTPSPAGSTLHIWCTYSDADNDPPTYVRVVRSAIPTPVQTTTYAMIANDSGTNYVAGKTYHYDWLYFPFIGNGWVQIQVKSGADAQVIKNIVEAQQPLITLTKGGVAPISDQPGNYTFFVNYTDLFTYAPSYIRVNINGTNHDMTKNNSGDATYYDGVNYSFTATGLTPGNYTYSFHAAPTIGLPLIDVSTGTFWFIVEGPSGGTSVSFAMLIIVAVLCGAVVIIWRVK